MFGTVGRQHNHVDYSLVLSHDQFLIISNIIFQKKHSQRDTSLPVDHSITHIPKLSDQLAQQPVDAGTRNANSGEGEDSGYLMIDPSGSENISLTSDHHSEKTLNGNHGNGEDNAGYLIVDLLGDRSSPDQNTDNMNGNKGEEEDNDGYQSIDPSGDRSLSSPTISITTPVLTHTDPPAKDLASKHNAEGEDSDGYLSIDPGFAGERSSGSYQGLYEVPT